MISRTREYYNYLEHKARSTHGNAECMTDKEKKDLELWREVYYYEEVARKNKQVKK